MKICNYSFFFENYYIVKPRLIIMARGTDWLNLASNVQQNRQLAAMQEQQEQMMMMDMLKEMNRQNIIEMRKMVINLARFAEKAPKVYNSYPAYAIMMTEFAIEKIDEAGINADSFEEISDMEITSQMNTKMRESLAEMKSSSSQEIILSAQQMKIFISEGEDEMEALIPMCIANEDWTEHAEEFAVIDPLHRERKKKYHMYTIIPLVIGTILFAAGLGMSGDCLVYDADDICTTYENESFTIDALNMSGLLLVIVGILIGVILFFWSRKYLKEWSPLNDKKLLVEELQEPYTQLSHKYGMTSSQQVINSRQEMIDWVTKVSPTDETMKLQW